MFCCFAHKLISFCAYVSDTLSQANTLLTFEISALNCIFKSSVYSYSIY